MMCTAKLLKIKHLRFSVNVNDVFFKTFPLIYLYIYFINSLCNY